jgi:protein-disulfide isomerase
VHPHADHAAEAAEAAGAQGNFWGMHETLFRNQQALDDKSLAEYAAGLDLDARRLVKEVMADAYASHIREDFRAGVRAGVNGTPSFFINGRRSDGAHELEPLLAAILQSGSDRRKRLEKLQSLANRKPR